MKPERIKPILRGLTVLAMIVFVASWIVAGVATQGAQLVQLVQPEEAATSSLFAENPSSAGVPGTPIGSPQPMLIRDEKAFLPGLGPQGERYVNDSYLRTNGIFPLQVKTVLFFRDVIAAASGFASLILAAGLLWLNRSSRQRVLT